VVVVDDDNGDDSELDIDAKAEVAAEAKADTVILDEDGISFELKK
jgi:hypothetical protein